MRRQPEPPDARCGVKTLFYRLLRRYARPGTVLFCAVLAAVYVFGAIAEDVVEQEAMLLDEPTLRFLHALANPVLDQLMLALSVLGSSLVLAPFNVGVFFWLYRRGQRWHAAYWAVATGGAALINFLSKHLFHRARPNLWASLSPETTFSFPSGHAMQTMAVCSALLILCKDMPLRWPMALLAAMYVVGVGLSRIYLGVHYPSDVLGGWCASLCWCVGLAHIMRRNLAAA